MKKLITSTDALRSAIKKLNQAVSKNPTIPVISNLYLKARSGELELTATDLELTISCILPCECKEPFEMLIPFDFLSRLIGLLGSQPLEIELRSEKKGVIIAEGEIHQLGGLELVEQFPKIPDVPVKNKIELDQDFMQWMERAMATVSKDDLRPAMTQACLELEKGGMTIVSTDAHCLFRRYFPVPYDGTPETILISPKVTKAIQGAEKATLSWRQNHIALRADKITVIATRLDAKFPDYRVVIPNSEPTLTLQRQDLIGALMKGSLFNKRQVELHFQPEVADKFTVHAADVEMERVSDVTLLGTYTGKTDKVAFAPALFETVLEQIPFDEIRLHIDGPKRGVLITAEEEPNYTGMIMPLLLNN